VEETNHSPVPIFDGHNDTLLSLRETGRSFFERADTAHIDLPRAREGGLAGGFFAVWVPNPEVGVPDVADPDPGALEEVYGDTATMPKPMGASYAQNYALASIGMLYRLEAGSGGAVKVIRSADDLRMTIDKDIFATELHLEGAEPIDEKLESLPAFYEMGVRSIGLVWSRPNVFAAGVPFKFPSSPDTGPGLTDAGKALVQACNELGILVDVSHLNEAGFWDVAKITTAPIVATHSCAHAICPAARNLTDGQLDAIRESDGIVGVNFHVGFLRPDGADNAETPLSVCADHFDYLVDRIGIERVAFGSDFDGALMPTKLGSSAGLQRLVDELRTRGYDEPALRKLGYENWLRIFERTWLN
jgi:membrane dipeptidase